LRLFFLRAARAALRGTKRLHDMPPTRPVGASGSNQGETKRRGVIYKPPRDNGEHEAAEPQRKRQRKLPERYGQHEIFSTQAVETANTRDTMPHLAAVRDFRNATINY
jgi:hypothetical protein